LRDAEFSERAAVAAAAELQRKDTRFDEIRVLLVIDAVAHKVIVRAAIELVGLFGAFTEALGYVGDPAFSRARSRSVSTHCITFHLSGRFPRRGCSSVVDSQAAILFELALCKCGCDIEGPVG
jgi:hypothetical protein